MTRHPVLLLLSAALLASSATAFAQSTAVVQDATTYARTLAPTSAGQVVNPAGVNTTAWGTSTTTPTAVPANLGGFSAPTTSNATYANAKSSSLSALGTKAMVDCANYVPGSPGSTPAQTQACAAVNFMTNQCLTPTTQQGAVLSHVGASQNVASNCAGTYGAGANTFNFQNQITATDPVFTVVKNLGSTAATTVGSTCSTQNVVTSPAQFALNNCVKSGNTTAETCSQYLNVSVTTNVVPATTTDSCPQGQLVGEYCVSTTSVIPTQTYACPAGTTMSGSSCIGSSTDPSTPTYSCPSGYVLSGSTCTLTTTSPPVQTGDCSFAEALANGEFPWGNTSNGYPFAGAEVYGPHLCYFANYRSVPNSQWPSGWFVVRRPWSRIQMPWWFYPEPTACPSGSTFDGSSCVTTTTTTGTITGYYCPTGTLSGTNCVTTVVSPATETDTCPAGSPLTNGSCVTSTSTPAVASYSCSDGSVPVNGACILHGLAESWTSTCGPYEASAGAVLPNP